MATYRLKRTKLFSLDEGKFTGERFSAGKTYTRQTILGAATGVGAGLATSGTFKGALIGAGIGTIIGLITSALTRSIFNKDIENNITTKNLFKEFSNIVDYIEETNYNRRNAYFAIEEYELDSDDPKRFDVSVKSNEDSIVMYIRELSRREKDNVSKILDTWCINSKNNDYVAEKVKTGGWIVTMTLVNYESAANLLVELMNTCRFRINFVTK